jgi:hypothetical protein
MLNPFRYGGIVRGPYFADRHAELAELTAEMGNLNRVFLISPRRYGKSCLLLNLLDRLRENGMATAYLDLNAYPDLEGFAAAYTQATVGALESNFHKLLKLLAGMTRLRPKVVVGPDGELSGSVELATAGEQPIPALLEGMQRAQELANTKNTKLVVVIDEFSDLPKYDGGVLEKAMRSQIQRQENVGYIFSGSERSIMLDMIQDRNRAFYKIGRLMELKPIPRDAYAEFISGWLERGGFNFQNELFEQVFEQGRDVPYNVQRLCHTMWEAARDSGRITRELVATLPLMIAGQDSPHFELLWRTATYPQRTLLQALSRDPEGRPFSKAFQLRHGVGPSSSIRASLDSLVNKGLLYRDAAGTYRFSDTFMPYWISNLGTAGN